MWSRDRRIQVLGLIVLGIAGGGSLEAAMDSFEDDGLAWVGLLGAMAFFAIVVHELSIEYYRRQM